MFIFALESFTGNSRIATSAKHRLRIWHNQQQLSRKTIYVTLLESSVAPYEGISQPDSGKKEIFVEAPVKVSEGVKKADAVVDAFVAEMQRLMNTYPGLKISHVTPVRRSSRRGKDDLKREDLSSSGGALIGYDSCICPCQLLRAISSAQMGIQWVPDDGGDGTLTINAIVGVPYAPSNFGEND